MGIRQEIITNPMFAGFIICKTFQLIGTEGTRLLREKRVQGRPHRRKERQGRTARKASAWSGKQRDSTNSGNYKIIYTEIT